MTANAKQILYSAMDGQESLRLAGRPKTAHVTFTLPCRLVCFFRSVVLIWLSAVDNRRHHDATCSAVAPELVGDCLPESRALALQELAKEPLRWLAVTTPLNQDVDHISVLIDRPPQVEALTADSDKHLVEQVLNVTEAQAEAVLEPNRVADYLGRESVSVVAELSVGHVLSVARTPQLDNAHAAFSQQTD